MEEKKDRTEFNLQTLYFPPTRLLILRISPVFSAPGIAIIIPFHIPPLLHQS